VYSRFRHKFEIVEGGDRSGQVGMVYCIAMPNRLGYAKQKMGELNTTYKLFHAVQKEELAKVDYTHMSSTYDKKNPNLYLQFTKLPVSLSFFMCYYDAYLNGYDTIMAGAYIRPLFSSTLSRLLSLTPPTDPACPTKRVHIC
jgi:hypothetical protein